MEEETAVPEKLKRKKMDTVPPPATEVTQTFRNPETGELITEHETKKE